MKLLAAFLAALVAAGYASAETSYDQTQDARIAQTRAVVKNLWIKLDATQEEIDSVKCNGNAACEDAVAAAYASVEQWPGWVEAAK